MELWNKIGTENINEADICFMGIPFDGAASLGKGAAYAPQKLRECASVIALANRTGRRFDNIKLYDEGDVEFILNWEKFFANVEETAYKLLKTGKFCIFAGGDHSVTIPLANALRRANEGKKIGFIHFDSHYDLYDEFEESRWAHACPLRRVVEDCIEPGDLVQIGIRSFTNEEMDFCKEHPELTVITADEVFKKGYQSVIDKVINKFKGYDTIYITLDIDVLDPAFAPGTGTPEAGGLSTRELHEIVNQFMEKLPVNAMDLVEVAPPLDTTNQITSWAGISIIFEVLAKIADRLKK